MRARQERERALSAESSFSRKRQHDDVVAAALSPVVIKHLLTGRSAPPISQTIADSSGLVSPLSSARGLFAPHRKNNLAVDASLPPSSKPSPRTSCQHLRDGRLHRLLQSSYRCNPTTSSGQPRYSPPKKMSNLFNRFSWGGGGGGGGGGAGSGGHPPHRPLGLNCLISGGCVLLQFFLSKYHTTANITIRRLAK